MANRFANMLGNTKTRTMVLLVLGILVFGVVIAVSQTENKNKGPETAAPSKTTAVPNQVKSTPGAEVTRKYQELQQKANERGAAEAAKKGTTFIPTLTGNVAGLGDQDFEKQLSAAYGTVGGKCSKEEVDTLKKKGMDTTAIILELKSEGCTAAQIAALFSTDQIAAALLAEKSCQVTGCTPDAVKALKAQGMTTSKIVSTLKANNCAVEDIVSSLKANGASADEIVAALKDNGYDATTIAAALSKAGYSKNDIIAALTKAGFSPVDIAKALNSLTTGNANNAALLAQQEAAAAAAERLNAQQEAQQLAQYSQQRVAKIQELVTAMETEKKQAMDAWNNVPQQLFAQGTWATDKERLDKEAAKSGGTVKNGKIVQPNPKKNKVVLRAGSILFAVLDTAVNSDEPGPIMATIVSGSLKGSKLMGTMATNLTSETISLNFTAINMPGEANSMGINAVAIDPDTARTALASDVDHHYLYRWGSLLASSFVQGYATAVASSGTSSTTSSGAAGVTTTTSSPPQNNKQQLFSGIAAVGTKWSQVVGQNFNRPITITIDQGTGIGVLVTADMVYGTNPIFYKPPESTSASAAGAGGAAGASAAAPSGSPASVPGALGSTGGLTNDQRQALWGLLQNQPVTTTTAGSSNVTTTSTMPGNIP